jgi:rfaE bifunctional protein nucleotidyltransferase chain/domain
MEVLSFDRIEAWRARQRGRVVATNGCFDILHAGHLRCLQQARALGDSLIVGVNDDAGVRQIKGSSRPFNPVEERAEILAALRCVDAAAIFPGANAAGFLERACPHIYVKGGDYTPETLDVREREVLEKSGVDIRILPLTPGRSTTRLLETIAGETKT